MGGGFENIDFPFSNQLIRTGAPGRGRLRGAHEIAQPGGGVYPKAWSGGGNMNAILRGLWSEDDGQDIAEYAVMLAVILVLVVGTIRLVGSSANNAFSAVASSLQ